jgi:hypothetical protein
MKRISGALTLAVAAAALLAPAVSSAAGTTTHPAKAPHQHHDCPFASPAAV